MITIIQFVKSLLPDIKDIIELTAIVILIIGTFNSIVRYLFDTISKKHNSIVRFNIFKVGLGRTIAASLELAVVADLINTTIDVDYNKLGMLLILVIIRTIIGYFLNKDLENIPTAAIND